ncbi:MAG: hypothetical protein ACHRXM_14515 [Isosphaerales bacterium]
MPAIWQARSGGVSNLVMAGALALGLSGLLPLHAQEPGSAAKSSPRAQDQTTRLSAPEQDSGSLRAHWRAQQIASRKAEAEYNNAKLTREIAEIAVLEYAEGIFFQDLATIDGEIKLAKSDLSRSEDRLDWARRMFDKGFIPIATKNSEELNFKRAGFSLEQAQSKKRVLVEFTQLKTIKELKSEIEKARSNELAKKTAWEREKAKEAELERQVGQSQAIKAKPESR